MDPKTPLAQRLAPTIAGMRIAIANATILRPALMPFVTFLYNYLNRALFRLDRLALKWQANTLPKKRPSRVGRMSEATSATPRKKPEFRLGTSQMWLGKLIQPSLAYSGWLNIFINEEETRALIQAAPQAGRILRPLCKMLGVPLPDHLRLPPRPKRPKPPKPPKAAKPKDPPFRVPFPKGLPPKIARRCARLVKKLSAA